MSREAFERHCPMPKGLVFNASLNRYDGGVYTSALSYNDMWCAWQHAWQAALQSGEPVVPEGYVLVPVVPDRELAKRVAKRRRQFEALCAQVRDPRAGKGDDE